jgi:uncharacterized protein YyaL (SSP411 family)
VPNRLARETSPYLLQHKDNPVDWYPWGAEALERARREGKPIFLSVGYSACHWCHVMERESFENGETARLLNERFVSIKVDREERPDLDAIYMESVQAMTGSGGWPLTVFLTPDARPFFGGTYFPPEERHGLPSFRRVLLGVSDAFRSEMGEVEERANRLADRLRRGVPLAGGEILPVTAERAAEGLARGFDERNGGFGGAPKFPQPMNLDFLLRHARRTGNPEARRMAIVTLERMARGGIHDHLGGGFHRYSTDPFWLVPHFEKMLYDNALLARLHLHAYQAAARPFFRSVARRTLDYMLREMTGPEGELATSQDADSEGGEGTFFLWTREEIVRALGEAEGNLFALAYGASERGNFEGRNILNRLGDAGELASRAGLSPEEMEAALEGSRLRLFAAREKRPRPARDGKAIAAWNGLALAALADAARVLDDARYREAAVRVASFIDRRLMKNGGLFRVGAGGVASIPGFLEDHACAAEGLLALYEATFDERWFRLARSLADAILERFADDEGGFFDAGDGHEALIARPKNVQDNATPSGNASAARVLLRLAAYGAGDRYAAPARRALGSMRNLMERHPGAFGHWLGTLEFALATPLQVAILGARGAHDTEALVTAAFAEYAPHRVAAAHDPREGDSAIPFLERKAMVDGAATAYLCRSFACGAPITNPEKLATDLAS